MNSGKVLIDLAEFSEKLQQYRQILERLRDEQESYSRIRERLSKLSQRRCSEIKKPTVTSCMCNAGIKIEDSNSFATCRGCERLVCRNEEKRCCEWISAIGIWECSGCRSSRVIQQKAGEWLLNQLTRRLQNPGPINLTNEKLLGLCAADSDDGQSSTSSISSNQKVKVREFIEELLSTMLNGPLDDVSVGQLMKNESYVRVFHRYHSQLSRCLSNLELSIHQSLSDLPICENQKYPDSPSDQHFQLRKLLQRILDEVAKLPELLNQSGHPLRPEEHLPYFSPKKYEQLLATAVLNKVVEDYRNPKNFEHEQKKPEAKEADPAAAAGTTFDINHNKVPGKSLLNKDNLRQMSLNTNAKEAHSSSSLSESDESYLSDYIQKHTVPLPDLSDTTGSGPEDDLISLKSNATDGTWEENWLFKKRKLKTTESAIAMLVPSPTEEVKALIGDKNADEVSDLSEAGSDLEDYDSESNSKDLNLSSKSSAPNTAGTTNTTTTTNEDAVQDSLVSINSIPSCEPILSEAKNSLLLSEQAQEQLAADSSFVHDLISMEPFVGHTETANSRLLGEAEFVNNNNNNVMEAAKVETDDVKLLQERIQNAPKQCDSEGNVLYPVGVARTITSGDHTETAECDRKEIPIDRAPAPELNNGHDSNSHEPIDDGRNDEGLIPGSIAEREHLKWQNASPIANNPYSPDILQKRLSDSHQRSSFADFDRLAGKDLSAVTLDSQPAADAALEIEESEESKASCAETNRSLQSVVGGNPTPYTRYGRDYYINDAKRASGSRKHSTNVPPPPAQAPAPTHSTDDEKDQRVSDRIASGSGVTSSDFTPLGSYEQVTPVKRIEDIFLTDDVLEDTLSKKGQNAAAAEEPITPQSLESFSEISTNSRADESLTYSEDSDITRIYEIGTGETKLIPGHTKTSAASSNGQQVVVDNEVVSEEILEIIPQISGHLQTEGIETVRDQRSPSPSIDRSHLIKPRYVKMKQLSPETIRFFSPKKAFTPGGSNLTSTSPLSKSVTDFSDLSNQHSNQYHSTLHIDFPASRSMASHEFTIEKEVMEVLPSVKELAKCYIKPAVSEVPKPILRPRDFIRQSSSAINEESQSESPQNGVDNSRRMYQSTGSINAAEEIREIRRLNIEVYNQPNFIPMAPGHSITARSLSKQIREELKTNATDDHKVHGGHASPERPSSPVFEPGHLRSSIQFFENLKNK
ncbi:uncharacterized protein LOC128738769 isoform X2 [Sabethes cyaneus]|uniref:uncharacterized protein LOC128738769 isoform X2 n=1 Tax=Sabethes cyaneus TaxID=53552 RepID=UPI00237EC014|nr:uncharacterized protein LOC128738769 isoform X2 [Sabethes cyaneus]